MVKNEIIKTRLKVANILIKSRIENKLTQQELANLSGLSRSSIIRIEKGVFSPNADELYKLCKILKISLLINNNEIF